MEPFKDYENFDAMGLAQLVEQGDVHRLELVEAAASRIDEINPVINAVIWDRLDAARIEATAADQTGPFAGVPILIKDLVVEKGKPATFGSVFFRNYVGETTSVFRERVDGAGFIDLGRTNTPEFGLLPTTEPVLYGPTKNPWDPARSAGGSSGGAAAAVAAGIVPLAQGSDGGGSIRIPASATGLFGLKPSRGRNPRYPGTSIDYLSVEHALTRTVRDSAAFLDAVHGPASGDRYWAPPPSAPFAAAAARDPERLRVAFSTRDFRGDRVHPACETAVLETATLLEGLGHDVVETDPEIDGALLAEAFLELWAALAATGFGLVLDGASELKPAVGHLRRYAGDRKTMRLISRFDQRDSGKPAFEPFTFELAERSGSRSQVDLLGAEAVLQSIAHQTGAFLVDHDVFLTPVLGSPPVPLGRIDQSLPWDEFVEMIFRYVAFTPLGNFAGLPAMSVPLHWTSDGLPVGSHFLGRFGAEETLFSLAAQLERAQPWADRKPPIAVSNGK
ncbi:MAG: amidase family protein [Actinomycetota bacterium]|nr:amidase family protein [Actinomycetota bacterium]